MKRVLRILLLLLIMVWCGAGGAEEPSPATPLQQQTQPPLLSPADELKDLSKADDHFMKELLNMLATLGMLIAFILIASWFLKKMLNTRIQQVNQNSDIKIFERRALTPKTTIYIVEIKGKGYSIAESANGVTLLGTLTPEEIGQSDAQENPVSFGKILKEKIDKGLEKK